MGKYNLSKVAEEDLVGIYEYGILNFGIEAANSYYDRLIDTFDQIAKSPLLFPYIDEPHIACHRCVSGVHAIYYDIVGNDILILAVVNRQDVRLRLAVARS